MYTIAAMKAFLTGKMFFLYFLLYNYKSVSCVNSAKNIKGHRIFSWNCTLQFQIIAPPAYQFSDFLSDHTHLSYLEISRTLKLVYNFEPMKNPVELKFFCYVTWFYERWRLANEAYLWNSIFLQNNSLALRKL